MTHGFLGSLIMNLILVFQKQNGVFKMADDFRGLKFFYPKNHDLSVFEVADYESDIGFSNQEIADRKWL